MNEALSRRRLIEAIPLRMRDMIAVRSRLQTPAPWLELDLTMKQLKVLFVLDALGPQRPSAIAASVGVSAASATGVLDRLVDQGYIERRADAVDRRALLVQLTESGAQIVSDLHMSGQQQLSELLAEMSNDDLDALYRGVTALADAGKSRLANVTPVYFGEDVTRLPEQEPRRRSKLQKV